MGPDAHVVCYDLVRQGICNVVLTKPNDDMSTRSTPSGPQPTTKESLHTFFADWDEQLRDVISLSTSVMYWPMLASHNVNTWTHLSGTCILIGDAAHSTEPHLYVGPQRHPWRSGVDTNSPSQCAGRFTGHRGCEVPRRVVRHVQESRPNRRFPEIV